MGPGSLAQMGDRNSENFCRRDRGIHFRTAPAAASSSSGSTSRLAQTQRPCGYKGGHSLLKAMCSPKKGLRITSQLMAL
jgi:hypothetical protein